MGVFPIDWDEARSAATRATHDVAGLLRGADGPARVPGLEWNVAEVGAHLVTVARGYVEFALGAPSSLDGESMAAVNEQRLEEFATRDTTALADQLVEASDSFLATIEKNDSLMSLSEVPLDRATATAVWLGELRIHELDMSRALRRRWRLSREEALLISYGGLSVVHKFVDHQAARGLRATYEVRFRGGETVSMIFQDGELTVARGRAPKADCRMSADPLASLLVGFGRMSPWRAGLQGKVAAWGKKPWLSLRFNRLLMRV